jgi:hypothetical protein
LRVVWPATAGGSFALAFLSWPVLLLLIDTFGYLARDIFPSRDLGLVVFGYLAFPGMIFALVAWFRAFILAHDGPWWQSAIMAVILFPAWYIAFACITFLFFPFGRIDPNF